MKALFRRLVNKAFLDNSRMAYAQAGEDLILAYLFHRLGIEKPSYLDIGANHPCLNSNTYYFYLRGSRGICVEPNPKLCRAFRRRRPADLVLQAGVGPRDLPKAVFYMFGGALDGLSTFSRKEAEYWQEVGMEGRGKIAPEQVIEVPVISINALLARFPSPPDLVSIDVEGLDLDLLQALDFRACRPLCFCVETLGYDGDRREYQREEIGTFLGTQGYTVYAHTHINTIFLDEQRRS